MHIYKPVTDWVNTCLLLRSKSHNIWWERNARVFGRGVKDVKGVTDLKIPGVRARVSSWKMFLY